MNDLVSVVITSYGRTNTLSRAIESVIAQTYSNIEIIVVDDNSDKVYAQEIDEICNSFNNDRIIVIHNAQNLGGSLARNEGIKAAKGAYIAFLDDDDEYLSCKIEKQLELFVRDENPKLGLVYEYCYSVKNNKKFREYKYNYVGNCLYEGMLDCIAATSQWMCKKLVLEDIGMFTDSPCKQDFIVILKMLLAGYEVNRVPEFLSVYHLDEDIRISTGGHKKRIIGECRAREICRSGYHKLTKKQCEMVEHSFACRLAEHYLALGDKNNFRIEIKKILKFPLKTKTIKTILKLLLRNHFKK